MKPLPASSGDLLADRRADYAEALFASQDYADAAELMLGAVELAPGWALGWFRLGEMQEAAGDLDAAALAWTMALKLDPADRPGSALKLALIGKAPPVAAPPSAFVEALFDQYAPNFDTALVEKLGYRVPLYLDEAIRAAGEPSSGRGQGTGSAPQPDPNAERAKPSGDSSVAGERRFRLTLDLGCGTGLMGERLRPIVERLEGFDISAAMLRKAERKASTIISARPTCSSSPMPAPHPISSQRPMSSCMSARWKPSSPPSPVCSRQMACSPSRSRSSMQPKALPCSRRAATPIPSPTCGPCSPPAVLPCSRSKSASSARIAANRSPG
nr:methyltransferase domain-containing protein [Mesorhizobium amorphae]